MNIHGGYSVGFGMSLRDYFMSMPLELGVEGLSTKWAEIIMGEPCPKYDATMTYINWWLSVEAKYRALRADAMIAERYKK